MVPSVLAVPRPYLGILFRLLPLRNVCSLVQYLSPSPDVCHVLLDTFRLTENQSRVEMTPGTPGKVIPQDPIPRRDNRKTPNLRVTLGDQSLERSPRHP